jgi:hypothetical protein
MSLKQTLLLFVGSVLGMAGSFMKVVGVAGSEFVKGIGAGFVIVLAIDLIITKLIRNKNETTAK